jgi:hypothetical protein
MKFLALTMLFSSTLSFASEGKLFYTEGSSKGKDVTKNSANLGSDDICFKGNGVSAQKELYRLLNLDGEKDASFAKFSAKDKVLVYGFVDTKCTDEGESEKECRIVKTASRCK